MGGGRERRRANMVSLAMWSNMLCTYKIQPTEFQLGAREEVENV